MMSIFVFYIYITISTFLSIRLASTHVYHKLVPSSVTYLYVIKNTCLCLLSFQIAFFAAASIAS